MTEAYFAITVVSVTMVAMTGLVLWFWHREADATRTLIRTAFIHLRSRTPAEAVQAEAPMPDLPQVDWVDDMQKAAAETYTDATGSEFTSEKKQGTEYWRDANGEEFEVME